MSSRLNPREYDVVELRDALRVSQGRPGEAGSACVGSNRSRWQSDSGNTKGDVWLSASELDQNDSVDDDSSPSECGLTMMDGNESRSGDTGVETVDERSDYPADDGEGVQTSPRRSESPTDRPKNLSTDCRQDLQGEHSRRSTRLGDSELIPLDQLPNSVAGQMEVLDWLENLLSICSHEEALDALTYYRSIGWLSTESYEQLRDVLEGLDAAGPADPEPLGIDDHRESLRHIAALARFG